MTVKKYSSFEDLKRSGVSNVSKEIKEKRHINFFNVLREIYSKNNIEELYCGHCEKDTRQKVYDAGHERDSSNDRFECLECGWIKHGLTGEWEEPYKE